MPAFMDNLRRMPAHTKAAFAVAAVAILAITVLLLQIAGAPSYATLASGMEPAQTGKVTAALDEQGIKYELQANGTTVAVEKASVAKARVALATAGVASGGRAGVGFELFDDQKLGASNFQQKVTYQRALEGEIARIIGGVEGITGAQVQLVLPEDELFTEADSAATAAVMLEGDSDNLQEGAVRGIAQLVASSVKGLKTSNVTITDATGRLLWPQEGAEAGGVGASVKQAAEARYERELEASLGAMLARTLGPDKAQVQVKADLNVDRTTRNELTYARRGTPIEIEEETEELEGAGARAGGRAGTDGNIPAYGEGAAGGVVGSNYQRETRTTKNGVDKTVSRTEVAPGAVEGIQVALLVDESVDPAVFQGLEAIVERAAGMDPERGDAVEAMQVAFAKPAEEPKAGPVPVALLEPLKWLALGIATLVFLFFMIRALRSREADELPTPAWLTQISEPTPLSALEAGGPPEPQAQTQIIKPREPNFQLQTMEQMIEREPERVTAQVKAWMNEE